MPFAITKTFALLEKEDLLHHKAQRPSRKHSRYNNRFRRIYHYSEQLSILLPEIQEIQLPLLDMRPILRLSLRQDHLLLCLMLVKLPLIMVKLSLVLMRLLQVHLHQRHRIRRLLVLHLSNHPNTRDMHLRTDQHLTTLRLCRLVRLFSPVNLLHHPSLVHLVVMVYRLYQVHLCILMPQEAIQHPLDLHRLFLILEDTHLLLDHHRLFLIPEDTHLLLAQLLGRVARHRSRDILAKHITRPMDMDGKNDNRCKDNGRKCKEMEYFILLFKDFC